MSPLDILLQVVERLNGLNIPYMLSGAFATSFYGRIRSTHDIDLVVEIGQHDAGRIFDTFGNDYYVSMDMIEDAIRHHSMFNLIHNETTTKVDFWMLEDSAFDHSRFSRRKEETLEGTPVSISMPEDLIVIKLDWFKRSGVHKHYEDALGIVLVQQDTLDIEYIRGWCDRLSLGELCERLLSEAD
ncbi:MAG: hypothetical protein AB1384_12155 [Actinomycetota bacterium]